MKFSVVVCLAILLYVVPGRIAEINALKSAAKTAYNSGDYKTAIEKYKYLVDSLQVDEEEVVLNLANAYFQVNDTSNAATYYHRMAQRGTPKIKSLAHQQLGVMANRKSKFEDALAHFKNALKADPTNQDARYNYELLSKKLNDKDKDKQDKDKDKKDQDKKDQDKKDQDKKDKDKKDQDKKDQDKKDQDKKDQDKKDQDKKDQDKKDKDKKDQDKKDKDKKDQGKKDKDKKDQGKKDKDKKDQGKKDKDKKDQDKKDQDKKNQGKKDKDQQDQSQQNKDQQDLPPSVSEKLKAMKMSEEKAKMILDAMKHREIQYLQQKKRQQTQPKDNTKPDW